MSWDLFIQDIPAAAQNVGDIPDDFHPAPLGSRAAIIAKIHEVAPLADFSDPAWGVIEGEGYSIEVNLGAEEVVDGFALHVQGANLAAACVVAIIEHLGVRAIDSSTGNFFNPTEVIASLQQWRAYRDRVVGSTGDTPR